MDPVLRYVKLSSNNPLDITVLPVDEVPCSPTSLGARLATHNKHDRSEGLDTLQTNVAYKVACNLQVLEGEELCAYCAVVVAHRRCDPADPPRRRKPPAPGFYTKIEAAASLHHRYIQSP
jgi:hypothetical protein